MGVRESQDGKPWLSLLEETRNLVQRLSRESTVMWWVASIKIQRGREKERERERSHIVTYTMLCTCMTLHSVDTVHYLLSREVRFKVQMLPHR